MTNSSDKDKPSVSLDPAADEYRQRIAAAKKGVPVGGTPMPKIPPLNQEPGRTRAAVPTVPGAQPLSKEQMDELARRGQFIPGVGAGYAGNQPHFKDVAGGTGGTPNIPPPLPAEMAVQAPAGQQFVNPPRPEGAGLSPATKAGLDAVAKANAAAKESKKDEENIDDVDADLKKFEDQFDVDEFGNRVRTLLNNRPRREAIEKRCQPLKVEDLIELLEIRQRVPIMPGKLEITYRSMSGAEDIFIKRVVGKEKGSPQYLLDMYAMMSLCASLYAMNDKVLPSHLHPETGNPDEKLFEAKMQILLKYPINLLADISVNLTWFDRRVKRLLVVDAIEGF